MNTPQNQEDSRPTCPHRAPSMIPGHEWRCIDRPGHGGTGHYCRLVPTRESLATPPESA